jgi:multiple sugar transport system substrate-binding protein
MPLAITGRKRPADGRSAGSRSAGVRPASTGTACTGSARTGRGLARRLLPLACGAGIALAATIPAAQAASRNAPAARAAASSSVTLNFWGTESATYYAAAIKEYEQLHPGVTIVYHVFPFDDLDTIISSHMSTHDSSFAVYEVDEPRAFEFASKGWLVPMSSSTTAQLARDVPSEQLGEVSYQGKVWALPLSTSTQILMYNKAQLAKAGVTPPGIGVNDGWTWQQLYAAALKVHKATGKAGLLFDQVNRIYQLQPLPQGLGGGPGVTGPNGLTADLDNPAWIKAMQWYQNCFTTGVTPKSINATETASYFESGNAGFFWGGPWNYYPFVKTKGLSVGVAPTPHWAGHPTMVPTDSWAIGVNPYSPYRTQAMSFIEWLALTNAGAINLMEHSGGVGEPGNPPANEVALAKYWTLWPAPIADLMKYQLYHESIHRAHTLGWVQYELVVEQAFTSISDGSNVKTALSNAQSTLTEDFAALKTQQ